MLNLYKITAKKSIQNNSLTGEETFSIYYHDIFDYPLSIADMIRWRAGRNFGPDSVSGGVANKGGYYFREGREAVLYKRMLNERASKRKMLIAEKAVRILKFIPTIRLIAVTGSLAMKNSSEESDIDFMVVTKKSCLWTTRALVYLFLSVSGIKVRRFSDKNQKDKLCLNVWMDEDDLSWGRPKNFYTAHEIAQIVPLLNKAGTYEKFIEKNKWIFKYWPNSVKREKERSLSVVSDNFWTKFVGGIMEKALFKLQYYRMQSRITREVVTESRALFHPYDWGKAVLSRLSP